MPMNNESVGIAAEVAICKAFGLDVNSDYEARAEKAIVELLNCNSIRSIFCWGNIPNPIKHVAEKQNPVDFLLENGKTLSVKTNQEMGCVAPQVIGQPNSNTYFRYLEANRIISDFSLEKALASFRLPDNKESREWLFKAITMNNIDILIDMYWQNLFDCDYLLYLPNLNLVSKWNYQKDYKVFGREIAFPYISGGKFEFTNKTVESWNESNTLKYCGITVGNFQVHKNRDCFKFRFKMSGVLQLMDLKKHIPFGFAPSSNLDSNLYDYLMATYKLDKKKKKD